MEQAKALALQDIVGQINDLYDEGIVFAEKIDGAWTAASAAILYRFDDEENVPTEIGNKSYFLESYLIKDVIEVWVSWTNGQRITPEEIIDAVLYYAENDAYKPV